MVQILLEIKGSIIPESQQNIVEDINQTYIYQTLPTSPQSFGPQISWNWNDYFTYLSLTGLESTQYFINNYGISSIPAIVNNPVNFYLWAQYVSIGNANFTP